LQTILLSKASDLSAHRDRLLSQKSQAAQGLAEVQIAQHVRLDTASGQGARSTKAFVRIARHLLAHSTCEHM